MSRLTLVIHERVGNWARHIRPRSVDWQARVIETRSGIELEAACAHSACPLLVIDLGNRLRQGLEDMDRGLLAAPNALSLVLASGDRPGLTTLARELGATHVLAGQVPPPIVLDLLSRWVILATRRTEDDGWSVPPRVDLTDWEAILVDANGQGFAGIPGGGPIDSRSPEP